MGEPKIPNTSLSTKLELAQFNNSNWSLFKTEENPVMVEVSVEFKT
jgi:hypothetical protein